MRPRLALSLRAAGVRRGDKWVLRGITWQLRPGERWALLGENGAGKTQLLKLLSGDIWPTPTRAAAAARSYRAGRQALDLLDAKQRIAYLGGERQDKYARYCWNLRVRDVIATGLHRTDLLLSPVTRTQAKRVTAMLHACGIQRLAGREFLALSYGEKRLVLLARALASQPDWLLLDEVYNGLDAEYRRRIDSVLQAARGEGQSWIATAHRAMDVPPGTRLLIELSAGRIRHMKRLSATDFARLRARAGESASRTSRRRPGPIKTPAADNPVLLRLTDVDLFVGYKPVLRAVNWQLRRGEHWSVFGANGAGKSSFLKLLYGDLAPALGGKIERAGYPAGTPIFEWKRRVGYVSPELQTQYATGVDVTELVASGRHSSIGLAARMTAADLKTARAWLAFFELLKVAGRRARELSYGQLRRALIARAMAADPQILLLDEPFTGLDPIQRAAMKRLLERLMRRQVTIVAAVHHAEDLPRGMTRALHLHKRQARAEDF
ncbi:MAG TPA: ATP-binding cassette domain-containing protein [Steroidobacteraceae bacterium]|jgi:molybdate transport system ATP-binding protein|nr:ATP-binding cassette domain-containing protein [Steroidobacteraceae bacterium]